jgi:hypothetical protein
MLKAAVAQRVRVSLFNRILLKNSRARAVMHTFTWFAEVLVATVETVPPLRLDRLA